MKFTQISSGTDITLLRDLFRNGKMRRKMDKNKHRASLLYNFIKKITFLTEIKIKEH